MRTVLLASLRTHARRYVAAAVAIVIGVSFVVVTSALSAATKDGLVAGVGLPYRGADAVVSQLGAEDADLVVRRAAAAGDSAVVLGSVTGPVTSAGRVVGQRVDLAALAEDEALRWQELRAGRWPGGRDEVVADVNDAKAADLAVGDRVRIGAGGRAVEAEVVGLVDTPSASSGATLYLPWADLRPWTSSMWVEAVAYAGDGARAAARGTSAQVQPADEFVQERQAELTREVDVIAIVLLVFAAIALFVSVLVIANTFSILFAQRRRDLALLRCVGATRRQLLRSIRLEALALGALSSGLGLVLGTVLGRVLVAVARGRLAEGTMVEAAVSAQWYAAAFAVGLLVTVVAAWLPTRAVVRVSPLAALRPDAGVDLRTGAGRLRTAGGALAVLAGAALLGVAIATHSVGVMVAGGTLAFTGVIVLGPLLVPALVRLAGAPLRGTTARLAAGNAVRNPRRTAATTASLLIGVTLTTAVLTGLASSRDAVAGDMDAAHPLDLAITAVEDPLPDNVLADVRSTLGVRDAVVLPGVVARIEGIGRVPLLDAGAGAGVLRDETVTRPRPGVITLPQHLLAAGDEPRHVEVTVDGRTERLRVSSGDGWGEAGLVATATLASLGGDPLPRAVWARAEDGVDVEDLTGDLGAIAVNSGADLVDGLSERAWVELQLDVLTGAVVALLGVAVAIALIGIGNTLGLSVLERARENALLRALGLTRRQLRRMLAAEAVLLSVVATVLGTVIGVVFAWVAVRTLVDVAVDDAAVVLPWGQLLVVVLVAAAAGLLAGVLPSRRAARVAPAAGLALD
ncbi:FtsX-like permease family protein [Nocardioides sp. zg-579]|uniref:FtsX-like permease family protein n=1 Tax=Nocardioides marmotae TaxID=2663857 RepID=A0A6I3JD45_9ACTN|nr:ABC transporter permease [Nocardioides marmotae]MCR6032447.1 FtsX-like permease family protein [Gordonia jinghuaiqii]MTB96096.1 FtsX-like permease family protein [Nocardioides marmotae]QKD99823.1 ABC transporter permease [Nocardioides marmotae]